MRYFIVILFIALSIEMNSQVTPVIDGQHISESSIESTTETASTALKQFFENPWIEKIGKVQKFLKDASEIVSSIVTNLRMTRRLIETEQDIYELFVRNLDKLDSTEDFAEKWKYRYILLQLYEENLRIFEVFDLATQNNKGIIDDKGRILLIKETLKKALIIKSSMRSIMRRANIAWYRIGRKEQQIKTFVELFKTN